MSKLHIEKFKCFKNISITINQLTILVGSNGYGKSTVIQSMLLLRKALDSKKNPQEVSLNDVYGQNLGICSSVFNKRDEDTCFHIMIEDSDHTKKIDATFSADDDSSSKLSVSILFHDPGDLENKTFHYLSAERVGPRISQPLVPMEYLNVGVHGESTAQVIGYMSGRHPIEKSRSFPGSKNQLLENQVNFWLSEIFPTVKIKAKISNETLTSQILVENEYSNDNFSTNIGFGISYVLPIITTCLVADSDSYVIVENPEAHLHPAAQAAMGEFLARMAKSGLKIIVETHSDHVLEGIQLYVAENKDWSKYVTINSFGINKEDKQPCVNEITFNDNAEFSDWPDGFMDQSQKDFVKLRNIRKQS